MKIGIRMPSLKRSLSASMKGAVNRAAKKVIVPGYGEKGMGLANPKKAAYNGLYKMTTINVVDAICEPRKRMCQDSDRHLKGKITPQNPEVSTIDKTPGKHPCHRVQSKQIKALMYRCNEEHLDKKIINAIGRISKFEHLYYKRMVASQDLFSFIAERIGEWKAESSKEWVQTESTIATEIIQMLQNNLSADDICIDLKNRYNSK